MCLMGTMFGEVDKMLAGETSSGSLAGGHLLSYYATWG